jgi:hypothetical protein
MEIGSRTTTPGYQDPWVLYTLEWAYKYVFTYIPDGASVKTKFSL